MASHLLLQFVLIAYPIGLRNLAHLAAIGFYGDHLRVGYGSMGGWEPFGPVREITRAEGNVLYELDGRSALDLYKT